ncbi:MAG TPA: TlpA disulfide reductase family protein [Casimicrobiaceae bacterium]|nr:TlpA disulfide reductase family protein [Casimicrobiaceae bacterium]
MREIFVTVLVAVLVSAPAFAARSGEAAPSFALATAAGDTVELAQLRGRVVYVDFWASWCTPCKRSFPWMNELDARYRDSGLTIVAINVDKRRDDAMRFLRDVPARFTVVFDAEGKTPAVFDVKGMPSSYLIDREGRVAAVEEGFHDERAAVIEQRIRALLDRK